MGGPRAVFFSLSSLLYLSCSVDDVKQGHEDGHGEPWSPSTDPGLSFALHEEAEAPPVREGLCITAQSLFNINGVIKR